MKFRLGMFKQSIMFKITLRNSSRLWHKQKKEMNKIMKRGLKNSFEKATQIKQIFRRENLISCQGKILIEAIADAFSELKLDINCIKS